VNRVRIFAARLLGLFGRRSREAELGEEVRAHLEFLTEENIRRGMNPEEAQYAARREFGGVEQVKETYRERRGLPVIETFLQDLRFGARMLRKNPGFTATAVLTLALGIGANTAIFSMLEALVLRPLPVEDPQQIVVLGFQSGNSSVGSQFSVPEYRDIASQTSGAFSGVFGDKFGIDGLSVNGQADRIMTNYVTGNFFSTLRIKPLLGRFIVPGEGETPNGDPVIVLSYEYWRTRFKFRPLDRRQEGAG
jgi:MacB-like periplasmic core domain